MIYFSGPSSVGFSDFVTEGWNRVKGEAPQFKEVLSARELWFTPKLEEKIAEEENKEVK